MPRIGAAASRNRIKVGSMTAAEEARRFLRAHQNSVLSTLSKKLDGYPFGSLAPYMLDDQACPIILTSTLAEHTKNIEHDSRVSLFVHELAQDSQAHARLTVIGNARRLADQTTIKARYLAYFPSASSYFDTHDFFFYRIEPQHLRYIGGFGAIHWISIESYRPPHSLLAQQEAGIIEHMNQDHAENLRSYCRHYRGIEALDVSMIGIDCDGFDVRADGQILRLEFNQPVLDAIQARTALVAMAHESRQ